MKNSFKKNFSMVFLSNCIGFVLSVTMGFVLPIVFKSSIDAYGYVQLYLLYVSYYYIFDFGLSNGIYLKEGGRSYQELDAGVYSGQFRILVAVECLLSIIIVLYALFNITSSDKQLIAFMVAINIVIMLARTYATVILQSTSRIKEYSLTIITVKALNAAAVIVALLSGIRNYRIFIVLLTLGEFLAMVYSVVCCKDKLFAKSAPVSVLKKELKQNVSAGLNIIISGAAAMLMAGFARLMIENKWGIDAFAKISFTVSISNMFMLFINAVAVVLYPKLRNTAKDRQIVLYNKMRDALMGMMFVGITVYYPLREVLSRILPEYSESIKYMAILLPICLYNSKMSLLIQTYMNVLRLEKKLMRVNIISLAFSVLLTIISVYYMQNITLAVISMLVSQVFRTVLAEIVLSRKLNIYPVKDILYELILTIMFVICNWFISGILGAIIFIICVIGYLFFKRDRILSALKELSA